MWGVAYMGVAMYVGSDLYGSGCVCGEWPIWEWLCMWGVAYMGVAMYVGSDLYGSGYVCGE